MAFCKNRNGELGNGMRGMMGTWGIKAGMRRIRVGMREMGVGMRGIRVILHENLHAYCFG